MRRKLHQYKIKVAEFRSKYIEVSFQKTEIFCHHSSAFVGWVNYHDPWDHKFPQRFILFEKNDTQGRLTPKKRKTTLNSIGNKDNLSCHPCLGEETRHVTLLINLLKTSNDPLK